MKKVKCIGGSLLIMLSFVFFIGIVSSAAMMTMENALDHVTLISGMAQLLYLLLVIIVLKIRKADIGGRCGVRLVSYKEYIAPLLAAFCFSACSNILQEAAPIVEETVFRGLIMTKLRREMSAPAAIFISALLFAVIHFMAGGLVTVIHAFLGGLIFALAYEKTKSLLPAIVAHIFGNVGGLVLPLIQGGSAAILYTLAAAFLAGAVLFCVILWRKKE